MTSSVPSQGAGRYSLRRPSAISFEFFPPGDERMEAMLWDSVRRLRVMQPDFVSVTYGADGSTRDRTYRVVQRMRAEAAAPSVPHLTCVGATRGEIRELAQRYWEDGVRHIVALRGDIPVGLSRSTPRSDGFEYAAELVQALRRVANFEISVAAYPEKHPEARDLQSDIDNLKRKIDAGATRAITQFFFDTSVFLRFRDACAAAGIEASIVPGILPITRFNRVLEFAKRCGTAVPDRIKNRFDGLDDDPQTGKLIAAAVAIEQVEHLQQHGVDEFHFYTLNRAELPYAICRAIGVRPIQESEPEAA